MIASAASLLDLARPAPAPEPAPVQAPEPEPDGGLPPMPDMAMLEPVRFGFAHSGHRYHVEVDRLNGLMRVERWTGDELSGRAMDVPVPPDGASRQEVAAAAVAAVRDAALGAAAGMFR